MALSLLGGGLLAWMGLSVVAALLVHICTEYGPSARDGSEGGQPEGEW